MAFALVVTGLLVAGCGGDETQLRLANDGGLTVIVQPDSPQGYPGCEAFRDCLSMKRAILLDDEHTYAEDVWAAPGSVVRVFSEDCEELDSFAFTQQGGFGQTVFQIDGSGQVSTRTEMNVMGDPAAGGVEHEPCPLP